VGRHRYAYWILRRFNIGKSSTGNFVHNKRTNGQIEAVRVLIKLGVKMRKIDENYEVISKNETYNTTYIESWSGLCMVSLPNGLISGNLHVMIQENVHIVYSVKTSFFNLWQKLDLYTPFCHQDP
jgi:hypothetical protein